MTWIPCGWCHQCPCICASRAVPVQNPYPFHVWTGTLTHPKYSDGKLSDDDVERIAKRVVELLSDRLPMRVTRVAGRDVSLDGVDEDAP